MGGTASASRLQLSNALRVRMDGIAMQYVRFLSIPRLANINMILTKLRSLSSGLWPNQIPESDAALVQSRFEYERLNGISWISSRENLPTAAVSVPLVL